MNEKITKEIDRIVNKYPYNDSKELFRAELEYLALLANREGYVECYDKLDRMIIYPGHKGRN